MVRLCTCEELSRLIYRRGKLARTTELTFSPEVTCQLVPDKSRNKLTYNDRMWIAGVLIGVDVHYN